MSIPAQKARNNFTTFILVAGLTALLLVIGQLVGGTGRAWCSSPASPS